MFAKRKPRKSENTSDEQRIPACLPGGSGIVILAAIAIGLLSGCEVDTASVIAPDKNIEGENQMAIATFAAGCFWGVEASFRRVKGVTDTTVGYTGGHAENPNYEEVCTGTTGHAEAVRVEYDPEVLAYEELLDVFWGCHNPTTRNRQGPDIGTQYRSAIFYHTPEQKAAAERSKKKLEDAGEYDRPIVTEIVPASEFYRAEEYHQQYLEKQGRAGCGL